MSESSHQPDTEHLSELIGWTRTAIGHVATEVADTWQALHTQGSPLRYTNESVRTPWVDDDDESYEIFSTLGDELIAMLAEDLSGKIIHSKMLTFFPEDSA